LRGRSKEYKADLVNKFVEFTKSKFEDGTIKPLVDKAFDWKEVAEAHKYMESNKSCGKIILTGM